MRILPGLFFNYIHLLNDIAISLKRIQLQVQLQVKLSQNSDMQNLPIERFFPSCDDISQVFPEWKYLEAMMRRNCSHCDIEQMVNEEMLGVGWVFVKCHLCGEVSTLSGSAWKNAETSTEQKIAAKITEKKEAARLAAIKEKQAEDAAKILTQKTLPIQAAGPVISPVISKPAAVASKAPAFSQIKKMENYRGVFKSNLLPVSLALICVGSGFYILDSVNRIKESSPIAITAEAVPQSANERASEKPGESAPQMNVDQASGIASSAQPLAAEEAVAHPIANREVNRAPAIVDRIDLPTQAAPIPPETASLDQARRSVDGPAIVIVRAKSALLRSGPGQGFVAVGNANVADKLILKGSKMVANQNWLQVQSSKGLSWIRADLVNIKGSEGSTQ